MEPWGNEMLVSSPEGLFTLNMEDNQVLNQLQNQDVQFNIQNTSCITQQDDDVLLGYDRNYAILTPNDTSFFESTIDLSYTIYDIVRSDGGTIYLATSKGLIIVEEGNWFLRNHENSELPSPFVNDLEFDSEGNLWAATGLRFSNLGGLLKIDTEGVWTVWTDQNSDILTGGLHCIYVDDDFSPAKILYGNKNGMGIYDGTNWQDYSQQVSPYLFSIAKVEGLYYLGLNGLNNLTWDGENNWTSLTVTEGQSLNNFNSDIFWDSFGSLWIRGTLNGIQKLQDDTWSYVKVANSGLEKYPVMGISEQDNGSVWMGSSYMDIYELDAAGNWEQYNIQDIGFVDRFFARSHEHNGKRYFVGGVFNSIHIYSRDVITNVTNIVYQGDGLIPQWEGDFAAVYYQDVIFKDEFLYIATTSGLVIYNVDTNTYEQFITSNSDMPGNLVKALEFDSDGNVWMATEAGLVKFDGLTFELFDFLSEGISNSALLGMSVDEEDKVYFVTSDYEFASWKDETLEILIDSLVLDSHSLKRVLADSKGGVWLGYSTAVFRFFDGKFTSKDISSLRELTELSDETIWIGGKGVCVYDLNCAPVDSSDVGATGLQTVSPKFAIYPIPTSDVLIIESETAIESLEIFDLSGRSILMKDRIDFLSEENAILNVGDLGMGIYVLRITTENRLFLRKIYKE